jgi:hypothetical protein
LDAWLVARVAVREEVGGMTQFAFTLQPLSSTQVPGGTLVWWGIANKPLLGLVMAEQHFFDLYDRGGRKFGSFLNESPPFHLQGRRLSLTLDNPILRTVPEGTELTNLVVGSEWKVLDFQLPATP